MTSRDAILSALRAAQPEEVALPDLSRLGAKFDDRREQFAQMIAAVGGRCVRIANRAQLEESLMQIFEYANGRAVASLVPGVARANVELAKLGDPHQAANLDFLVVPAELGVAENGACWITNHGGLNRSALFLTQHLAVVLDAAQLVDNLHDAYARIVIPTPGFALWLSGPSKTADIEQSLVIGAHGARSCTVLLVG